MVSKSQITLIVAFLSLISAKLIVYSPIALKEVMHLQGKDAVNTSVANFGLIPYGHSIIGQPFFDKDNEFGCLIFDQFPFSKNEKKSPIVVVRRGNCSFVQKARNIENAGGKLAIIVDEVDNETMDEIIMVDDGTGSGVKIPTLMINKKEGEAFIKFYNEQDSSGKAKISLVTTFDIVSFP